MDYQSDKICQWFFGVIISIFYSIWNNTPISLWHHVQCNCDQSHRNRPVACKGHMHNNNERSWEKIKKIKRKFQPSNPFKILSTCRIFTNETSFQSYSATGHKLPPNKRITFIGHKLSFFWNTKFTFYMCMETGVQNHIIWLLIDQYCPIWSSFHEKQ